MRELDVEAGAAVFSECGAFRYRLERMIEGRASNRTVAFIMVNPSTADAVKDDHTIRKVRGFAERHRASRLIVGNKFAFRATRIQDLRGTPDPVGPDNDRHLEQIMRDADLHVVAWGTLAKLSPPLRMRWREVVAIAERVGCRLLCLGTAQDRHPLHPLMLSYRASLIDWPQRNAIPDRP
jgi:hypothetical protein